MVQSTINLNEKIAGSLYGLLVGDALGCPVEGMDAKSIQRQFGIVDKMTVNRRRWRPLGLHSDDGQQALAVCDAIIQNPEHPGPGFAELLVDLYMKGPKDKTFGLHRGTGKNFRKTVLKLADGSSWDRAGCKTAGNGAAMRIAPAALYYKDDRELLENAVIEISLVTHRDIRGIAAAAAIAFLVSDSLNDDKRVAPHNKFLEMIDFVKAVEEKCPLWVNNNDHKHEFSKSLRRLGTFLDQSVEGVLIEINKICSHLAQSRFGPTSGFVLGSVLTSIFMFLKGDDFKQTVIDAVNLGGDTDTIGAMVGAMCGAKYGLWNIPESWLDDLEAFGYFDDRVEALCEKNIDFHSETSLIDLEMGWSLSAMDETQNVL